VRIVGYSQYPEYDGQFLRSADYAPAGAQIGEAWAIAAQIEAGDATSWYNAWSSYAVGETAREIASSRGFKVRIHRS
jgi:hypothetical protein